MFHMSRSIFIICMHIPGITLTSSRTPPHSPTTPDCWKYARHAPSLASRSVQAGFKPARITVMRRATAASDDAATAASSACKQ